MKPPADAMAVALRRGPRRVRLRLVTPGDHLEARPIVAELIRLRHGRAKQYPQIALRHRA